ncbi:hypothetical protein H0X10_02265 [Candidatus Saccharibacteria bacterium]|nr:hypothetical protein [Candidatus Saccharibacteria bacterium]
MQKTATVEVFERTTDKEFILVVEPATAHRRAETSLIDSTRRSDDF